MGNLVEYAKKELERYGAFNKESMYGGMIGEAVLELMEVFAKQGHSGMSASVVRQLFNKLADFKPLCALTFKNNEWGETSKAGSYQNIRNSAVFKEGKDGRPYYIDAYYKKTQNGTTWSGSLSLGDGTRVSRCYIKDPKKMPRVCIDILDWEVNKETGEREPGSGWWESKIKDISQLEELRKYYDLEIVKEKGD